MTKSERIENEMRRVNEMYSFQDSLLTGHSCILGIDEAGRGPLCGPVVAACVWLPDDILPGLNDSKKLTEARREELFPMIQEKAVTFGIGQADAKRIDEINILNATFEAMKDAFEQAVSRLQKKDPVFFEKLKNCLVLVDGNKTVPGIHNDQIAVVSGDARCPSIAAASILAKVTRDRLLKEYDRSWPQYGFAKHKGYGTPQHYQALAQYGPCPIHRKTFLK